jgi:hypothetical protein
VCLEIELVQNSFNLYWQLLQDRLTGVVRLSLEECYSLFGTGPWLGQPGTS